MLHLPEPDFVESGVLGYESVGWLGYEGAFRGCVVRCACCPTR